jgi:GT2 family glycosyltransferase
LRCRPGTEIIVVDDASREDDIEGLVRSEFPSVRYLRREPPNGFCYAINAGVEESSADYVMVLNNDVLPEEGAFDTLLESIGSQPDSCFAVVPSIIRPDGMDESAVRYSMRRGLATTGISSRGVPYPSGACSLYRRSAWEMLGGYDTRYAPIYWEDADLGARAVEAGLEMVLEPRARVLHRHAATMGTSLESETTRERNRIIFTRRHFKSFGQRLSHRFWLPLHLLSSLVRGNRAFLAGYARARSACAFDEVGDSRKDLPGNTEVAAATRTEQGD